MNNGNASQNIWDQMSLFNQLTFCNILNYRNNLGTPELRAAMASMFYEQRDDTIVFLKCRQRSWMAFPMVLEFKPLQMCLTYWTAFQKLSPMQGGAI